MACHNEGEIGIKANLPKSFQNRRDTITYQLDNLPIEELSAKKKILELADNVRHLYQQWQKHPREFQMKHQCCSKRRKTLLSMPKLKSVKYESLEEQVSSNSTLDLQEFTDWFANNKSDISLFLCDSELAEAVSSNPNLWLRFIKYLATSLHYADLHIFA